MKALKLKFGRFDFLIDKKNELWFLEVNSNGEWAWLDDNYQYGLHKEFLKQFGIKKASYNLLKRKTQKVE